MLFTNTIAALRKLAAFDASRDASRFVSVNNIPDDLDRLPDRLLPFMLYFLKQVKWPLIVCLVFYLAGFVIMTLMPLLVRDMVAVFENITEKGQLWPQLKPIIIQFVVWLIFVQTALYHVGRYVWAHTASALRGKILFQLNVYLKRHSVTFFQNDFAGRLSSKINDIAEGLRNMLRDFLFAFSYAMVQFAMSIYLGGITHPLFLVIFGVFALNYAFILWYFLPRILKLSLQSQDRKTVASGMIVDAISNIYNVKIFGRNAHENARLSDQLIDTAIRGRNTSFAFNKMYICLELNNILLWVASFGVLINEINNGRLQIADAALIVPVVLSIGQIVWWLAEALLMFMEQAGTIKDGMLTIVKPFAITDKKNAPALGMNNGGIAFKHVDFSYSGRGVFENLNIDIHPGQKIGLIGPSGAGKSTLVQLLLRLHDLQGGSIEIDGQNISEVTQDSLRAHIAVIPQSSDLLHRSIRENILYGRLDASEEDIIAAAHKAHAHEFILGLQDHEGRTGYDAVVGERGVKLSGGQRQRIAIARAVLKNAPILLLDEATSALDSESERLIQDSLHELMAGRTVIAIAHRLSTIAQLDRLLVMENGRIIEDGNHYELLQKKGLYARLWALQSGGFLPEDTPI